MNEWVETKGKKDVINLLVMTGIICHKHDKTKQGTMVLVETDMVLYNIWRKAHGSPAEFMKLFKVQVDKINVHGGRYRYHQNLYK